MDTTRDPPHRLLEEHTPSSATATQKIFTNADDAVAVKGNQQLLNKGRQTRSLDYSLRSLLAGGIAGCAVRHALVIGVELVYMNTNRLGL